MKQKSSKNYDTYTATAGGRLADDAVAKADLIRTTTYIIFTYIPLLSFPAGTKSRAWYRRAQQKRNKVYPRQIQIHEFFQNDHNHNSHQVEQILWSCDHLDWRLELAKPCYQNNRSNCRMVLRFDNPRLQSVISKNIISVVFRAGGKVILSTSAVQQNR